ncbi:hypothetical protein 9F7_45 [uncultured Caudovirales phage]|uniref:Uncharacterized protein n=1 Tax=uncultured Caudovirales phage TaxID=2100421 RepID=A0A2H4JG78_9CAUD|nr:hypothetical protein 3S4_88 [uncultured Caudovirales phage]ASN68429.1 hypothetical protein 3F6_88 [uncultured Caudovirales phage]ASN68482.1 hypothetical protein 9F7_45 [uncultured Caudovirales phage]ASN68613.1 hypothetical protein 8S7_80 [uncultured Caudovirales phage]ASN72116.1 hypothetical protein 7F6_15 [uncultured Caudovirales phage]
MDTNKMRDSVREQFEKFALSSEGGLFPGHLAKGEDGEYLNYAAQCYWLFWQASREAVVVELPKFDDYPASMERDMRESLRSSIEAQGMKVAP